MANSIDQSFMQAELNSLGGHRTADRLNQLIHNRRQPQRGRETEISPAKQENGTAFHVGVKQRIGMTTLDQPQAKHQT
tara:strand:- start:4742 stop:4975 length:234 start_codon:yes stop_codon:yes gene_type:complete